MMSLNVVVPPSEEVCGRRGRCSRYTPSWASSHILQSVAAGLVSTWRGEGGGTEFARVRVCVCVCVRDHARVLACARVRARGAEEQPYRTAVWQRGDDQVQPLHGHRVHNLCKVHHQRGCIIRRGGGWRRQEQGQCSAGRCTRGGASEGGVQEAEGPGAIKRGRLTNVTHREGQRRLAPSRST
jgi:hypothetical protein